jgi:hypothetical protein
MVNRQADSRTERLSFDEVCDENVPFRALPGDHQILGAGHSIHQRSGLAESLATRLIAPPCRIGRGFPQDFGGPVNWKSGCRAAMNVMMDATP